MVDFDLLDIEVTREWLRGNLVVTEANRDEWERLCEPGMIELTIPLLSEVVTGIQDQLSENRDADPEWRRKANAAKRFAATQIHVLRELRKQQDADATARSRARRDALQLLMRATAYYLADENTDDDFLRSALDEARDVLATAGCKP